MAPKDSEFTINFTPNDNCLTGTAFFDAADGNLLKESVKRLEEKVLETKNPVMYVFVNKGLKMNAGKVSAQVAHAQEELFVEILDNGDNELRDFQFKCMKQNPRTVIVLEAKNTEELYKINSYLESCNIFTGIYVDEGSADGDYMLEPTAIACQYLDKCDPRTETIFKMFNLFEYEDDSETEKQLETASDILNKISLAACYPSKKNWIKGVSNSEFRLEILRLVATWDEYSYNNNLLKYPRFNHETK